jgi:integrase
MKSPCAKPKHVSSRSWPRSTQAKFVFQSQIAFRELVERFLALHVPTLGSATRENPQTQIKNHILPAFGDLRPCGTNRTIVGTWLNAKSAAHVVTTRLRDGSEITKTCPALSWRSRSQLRGILSGIFTKAQEWNLWDGRNPCKGIDIGQKKAKRKKRIPKAADLPQFIEGIQENSLIDKQGAQLIVITAWVADLRVSEVLGLCRTDMDPEAEALQVERRWRRGDEDDPKSESSRRVRQIGAMANQLLAYAAHKKQLSTSSAGEMAGRLMTETCSVMYSGQRQNEWGSTMRVSECMSSGV